MSQFLRRWRVKEKVSENARVIHGGGLKGKGSKMYVCVVQGDKSGTKDSTRNCRMSSKHKHNATSTSNNQTKQSLVCFGCDRPGHRIGNEAWLARSVHWLMGGRPKSGGWSKIFTDLHSSFCIFVSHLEIGRQIIHQSIRLAELNLLQCTAKLFLQRFGGKFKIAFVGRGAPVHKKSQIGAIATILTSIDLA